VRRGDEAAADGEPVGEPGVERERRDEVQGRCGGGSGCGAEPGTGEHRLGGRDRGGGVGPPRPGDDAGLADQRLLPGQECGVPRASAETKCRDVAAAAAGAAPNMGRGSTGWGVGIEALASPIWAQATMPPLSTSAGFTAKKAGSQSTRSASLPGSTEPSSAPRPWATAGQIVYLAT